MPIEGRFSRQFSDEFWREFENAKYQKVLPVSENERTDRQKNMVKMHSFLQRNDVINSHFTRFFFAAKDSRENDNTGYFVPNNLRERYNEEEKLAIIKGSKFEMAYSIALRVFLYTEAAMGISVAIACCMGPAAATLISALTSTLFICLVLVDIAWILILLGSYCFETQTSLYQSLQGDWLTWADLNVNMKFILGLSCLLGVLCNLTLLITVPVLTWPAILGIGMSFLAPGIEGGYRASCDAKVLRLVDEFDMYEPLTETQMPSV